MLGYLPTILWPEQMSKTRKRELKSERSSWLRYYSIADTVDFLSIRRQNNDLALFIIYTFEIDFPIKIAGQCKQTRTHRLKLFSADPPQGTLRGGSRETLRLQVMALGDTWVRDEKTRKSRRVDSISRQVMLDKVSCP